MTATARPNLGVTGGYTDGEAYGASMNANLNRFDSLIHLAVKDKDLASPPAAIDGDRYIVAPGASGAWNGQSGNIATYEAATGTWAFYIPKHGWRARVVDEGITYAYSSASTTWYPDSATYNVKDFATVAAAIAAVPAGGRLYCPAASGPYTPPDANGWTINKAIEIFSDGPNIGEDKGFQYFNAGNPNFTKNSCIFSLAAGARFYLHDTVLSNGTGTPATGGTGDAIRYTGSTLLQDFRMERVAVLYAGRHGIYFTGANYVVGFSLKECSFYGCRGDGVNIVLASFVHMHRTSFVANKGRGLFMTNVGNGFFLQINAESNGDDLVSQDYDGQVRLENCADGQVTGCNFEDFVRTLGGAVFNGLVLNACRAVVVGGNEFDGTATNGRSIHMLNGTRGCTIMSNQHSECDEAVRIDSAANEKGNVILPQMILNGTGAVVMPAGGRNFAFVTNIVGGAGDSSGVGILLPSMPTVAAIDAALVRDGLLVYDSTAAVLKIRIGGVWRNVTVT